jgi:phenylacetate-CoA ligase
MTPRTVETVSDRAAFVEWAKLEVPAYKYFLSVCDASNFAPEDHQAWRSLPIMDKRNYIHAYPLEDLVPNKKLPSIGHASSGSSGRPTFWFRGNKQKYFGKSYYSKILRDILCIPKSETTLVIICFSLGVWVAGMYSILAFERIAEDPGENLSLLTPGFELADICSILGDIAAQFDHVVLVGYPGVFDLLRQEVSKRHLVPSSQIHLITSGDKSSEEWRAAKRTDFNITRLSSIVNVYGSSDAGIMAFETPLSIRIRRELASRPDLAALLFGTTRSDLPALFQYDPALIYFEELDAELLLTSDLDLPLIRYNIHDTGKLVAFETIVSIARELGIADPDINAWPYPFIALFGRVDVAVILCGAKIFPENIRAGLSDSEIKPRLSGSYVAFVSREGAGDRLEERFQVDLELAQGASPVDDRFAREISRKLYRKLVEINMEYRKHCSIVGPDAGRPVVRIFPYQDRAFLASCAERRSPPAFVTRPGAKPRMIM